MKDLSKSRADMYTVNVAISRKWCKMESLLLQKLLVETDT